MDGVVIDIITSCETPSVLMNLLRSWCVVVLVKFLKVLATCRNIWYAASLVADWTGEWIYLPLSLRDRFYFYVAQQCDFKGQGLALEPCSRGE